MSSHREAPTISKDPVADNTDTYAFVTPNDPSTVTIITNYLPAQAPNGGPNFYEFGEDVLYSINVDNDGDGRADVTYEFSFTTEVRNPSTFLYNVGPITTLDDPNWTLPQFYSVTKVTGNAGPPSRTGGRRGRSGGGPARTVLVDRVPCPPCNVGPRSTPDYESLAAQAVKVLGSGETVFAGQRADAFFVDLGSIFDLGALRPFHNLHLISMAAAEGVDALANANVQTIAIKVPISDLTIDGSVPTSFDDPAATIGVWGAASRQRALIIQGGERRGVGPFEQVSRLGNPLFNEVLVPIAQKDRWNASSPAHDSDYVPVVAQPELARLLPALYPGVFDNLASYSADRVDLLAVLLFGIPAGVVPGFQNVIGARSLDAVLGGQVTPADLLRLNTAIPASEGAGNRLGLIGGDAAGFPNGRRLIDDVTTIELRAVAGATIPLVDPAYTPDGAAGLIEDGTFENPGRVFLDEFPFIGTPYSGFDAGT